MPWTCPACQQQIRHSESEQEPRAGEKYRCHICRLELLADGYSREMVLAPSRADRYEDRVRTVTADRLAAADAKRRRRGRE
jgi:hypothetical protein